MRQMLLQRNWLSRTLAYLKPKLKKSQKPLEKRQQLIYACFPFDAFKFGQVSFTSTALILPLAPLSRRASSKKFEKLVAVFGRGGAAALHPFCAKSAPSLAPRCLRGLVWPRQSGARQQADARDSWRRCVLREGIRG